MKSGRRGRWYPAPPVFSVKKEIRLSAGKEWEVEGGESENHQEDFK